MSSKTWDSGISRCSPVTCGRTRIWASQSVTGAPSVSRAAGIVERLAVEEHAVDRPARAVVHAGTELLRDAPRSRPVDDGDATAAEVDKEHRVVVGFGHDLPSLEFALGHENTGDRGDASAGPRTLVS